MNRKQLLEYLKSPRAVVIRIVEKSAKLFKDDARYIRLLFRLKNGYCLDLDNPKTFNEKLNWLKLHFRDERMTSLADKYTVKEIVSDIVGMEYVVPSICVLNSVSEMDEESLPDRFVLKCTHDSGSVLICKDKASFDFNNARRIMESKMKNNYYWGLREWPYKNIKPRIIADEFLGNTGGEILDYKFMCFSGKPVYMYITIKAEEIFENYYDMDFNRVDISHGFKRFCPEFQKPESFEKMKSMAASLCGTFPFVRVDFFQIGSRPYFAEFTFFDWGGMMSFKSMEDELALGNLITLPEIN